VAVLASVLNDTQRRTLQAVCDTIAPSVQTDEADATSREFLARSASAMGVIQSEVSDHFAGCDGAHGFLIESVGAMPAVNAGGIPWRTGEEHKREFARTFRHQAPFLSVARDHGEGEVVLDPHGQPVIRWSLTDEVDRRLMVKAHVELARLQYAAGAPGRHRPGSRRGRDCGSRAERPAAWWCRSFARP
jgi:hypothetical protein